MPADFHAAAETEEHVDDLVTALLTASRVLVAVSVRSLGELEDAVTLPQFRTLVVLDTHGEMNLNRLAEILGVNSSSAMRMIDRLLAAELVTRRENPDNRRQVLLDVTPQAARMVRRVTTRRRREIAQVVDRMPDTDRSGLVAALRAFSDAAGEPSAAGESTEDEISPLGW